MGHDPILDPAPRRHDGRLGMHQWPEGHPVAYDPDDHEGGGDLCGDCASPFDEKGASFRGWGVQRSRFYFRCGGCKKPVFRVCTDRFLFPITGFAPAEGQEGRIRVQLLDGRLYRPPLGTEERGKYRYLVPCHLVYPYFASLTLRGIRPGHPCYEQAMDAMDLHAALRGEIERELERFSAGRIEEAVRGLRRLRRLQPRHLETTARIAFALEKAGCKAEAQWEWGGLAEAFWEAGYPEAAAAAQKGSVAY